MKKFLIVLSLLALVGCGSDFKYESREAKEKFLTKVMTHSDDVLLQQELKDIIVDLQLKAAKDEKAAEQLKEWQETQLKLIAELFGSLKK
ncbi:hypothetical protein [Fusobacterium sp.]|uniref:hypothetical protein n=1 Tax=Fusobacterium sp. TaxID=68766 RepID=UPI002602D7C1|nr:hypothetical protein [Fusobacterium sp.]